ncbi:MAG: metabolite traffic protein EboE [Microscillaceae bacterium]|nr:metabolite traffic protein EboE [Microscillaceae bacterium]
MQIQEKLHLTYCTNIHPGETWQEVFAGLQAYILPLKQDLSPEAPFGIGLRLSNQASVELLEGNQLGEFKNWLDTNGLYVFTMNGFPYGGFHRQIVKDQVHQPDWTTDARKEYTLCLFKILSTLLPEGQEGGISTSPLSYKYWTQEQDQNTVFEQATENILRVLDFLMECNEQKGQLLHLDIEPEPDGLLENSEEVLQYYRNWLIPTGLKYLMGKYGYGFSESYELILRHIQLCYDVCHFAIAYENHSETLQKFHQAGIQIGKFQISAALKADFQQQNPESLLEVLGNFNESTYLHQVIARTSEGNLVQFADLPEALSQEDFSVYKEWRIHFHVPVFLPEYQILSSTQSDIVEILEIVKEQSPSKHLEVETYTWEVLPQDAQIDLKSSIQRELEWVKQQMAITE